MYSGNSPAKSVARTIGYDHVLANHGYRRFVDGVHVVIASRDCGDIRYLVEHNVLPKNIVACDIDVEARKSAQAWGVLVSQLPTIEETVSVLPATDAKVSSINVDLCLTLKNGLPILIEVLESAHSMKNRPTILFTFQRCRDDMSSSLERYKALTKSVRFYRKKVRFHNYVSSSYNSKGSPMCLAMM